MKICPVGAKPLCADRRRWRSK